MANKAKKVEKIVMILVGMTLIVCVYIGFELGKIWDGYKVVRVVDGDTVMIKSRRTGEETRFRLMGINAPDLNQCFFDQSAGILEASLRNKSLRVEIKGRDGFGRFLGNLYAGNTDVAETLVRSGAAWAYMADGVHDKLKPELAYFEKLQKMEDRPKTEKIGVWSDLCMK